MPARVRAKETKEDERQAAERGEGVKANDDKTVTMPKGKKEGSQCQTSAPTRLLPTRRFPSSSPLAPRAVACSAPCLSPCARWQTKSGSRSESSWIEQKSERPRSLALFCWLRCQRRRDFASFVFFLLSSSPAPRSPSSLCERTSDVVLCRTKGLAPELRRRKRAKREGSVPFLLFLSLHLSLSQPPSPQPPRFFHFSLDKKKTQTFTGGEHLLDRLVEACQTGGPQQSAQHSSSPPTAGRDLVPFFCEGGGGAGELAPSSSLTSGSLTGPPPPRGKRQQQQQQQQLQNNNNGNGSNKKNNAYPNPKKEKVVVVSRPTAQRAAPSGAPAAASASASASTPSSTSSSQFAGPGFYVSPAPEELPPPPASLLRPRASPAKKGGSSAPPASASTPPPPVSQHQQQQQQQANPGAATTAAAAATSGLRRLLRI